MKVVNAITYLKDFKTDGHRPVLIVADDFQKYVIKPHKSQKFDYALFNELLAHHFLKQWHIHTPEIVLVKVEKELLKNSPNASQYKDRYYKEYFFGSHFIENAIELNNYLGFKKAADYKKIKDPEKLILLGLFDIWLENDDRKPSNFNILLQPEHGRFKITAIDNAFIFSSLPYYDIRPEYVCASFNDNVLYADLTKQVLKKIKPNKKWGEHQRDLFYICIKHCQNKFDEIIAELSPYYSLSEIDNQKLKEFLFSEERNKLVFNEFISRFN